MLNLAIISIWFELIRALNAHNDSEEQIESIFVVVVVDLGLSTNSSWFKLTKLSIRRSSF